MVSIRSTLAAGCLAAISFGAPLPSTVEQLVARSSYVVFGGTGALSEGWPARSSWASFESMWAANQGILTSGCGWSADQLPENSPTEISQIKSAIQSVSSSSGVDARFILAIVIQESNGCVRVHSTDNGVANPGLMQSHRGTGTCNIGSDKQVPCPEANILQMIKDGTLGTAAGDGLVGVLQKSGASDDSKYYKAARIYNSGSIAASRNIGDGNGATACYSSDVANRLLGFAGNTACDAGSVATLTRTSGYINSAPVEESTPVESTPDSAPVVESTPESTPVESTPVESTPVESTSVESTPAPTKVGGVFAELPAPAAVEPTPESTTAPIVQEPTPAQEAPAPVDSPVTEPTSSETTAPEPTAPVPTTTPETTTPEVTTPEVTTPEVTTPEVTTPEVTTPEPAAPVSAQHPGPQAAGSPCSEEGIWNCIEGKRFQQCASGIWAMVQSLAVGTQCTAGMSKIFIVAAI